MKSKNIGLIFLGICLMVVLHSCKKENLKGDALTQEYITAGRLSGTWANPTDIVVPEGVAPEVFGKMRLVFSVNDQGQPSQFKASDCSIIFSDRPGPWSASGTADAARVTLSEIVPVDEFVAKVSSSHLILSFDMGWENTETGEIGKGNFKVTLARQ